MKSKVRAGAPRNSRGASLRVLAAALAAASGAWSHAQAQEPPQQIADTRLSFDIPAQPLSSALSEFARQSGMRVLFAYDDLNGAQAPGLRGAFTREDALTHLLTGSGFAGRIDNAGVVRLEQRARPQQIGAEAPIQTADQPQPDSVQQARERPNDNADDPADEEVIVVTGTRIRGAAPAGANVLGLDRSDIEESGRSTLQDVLQTLPQVSLGSQSELTQLNSTAPGRNLALGSSIDLRGLGADATLTLLDGRRLAPAGLGNFVDISAIPLAAIERVEILADGASATYGADAVGGVVNIILRRDLDGAETTARYGSGDGFDEVGFSHTFGSTWSSGSLIAGYEYRDRGALGAAERDYAASSDLRPFGGTDFSRTNANPGNIIRVGATPVTFAIPMGQDGTTLTMADLLPGQLNRQNNNEGNFLLPAQQSHSAFLTLRQQLSPQIELFFDALASTRDAHAERPQLATTIQVPETNYYRQNAGLFTGQGPLFMGYFFGDDFGPLLIDTRSRTLSAAAGADIELFADWRLEAVVSYGALGDENDTANSVDVAALAPALASADPATAFNPFGDGSNTPASVLRGVTSSQFVDTDSELVTYALKADGGLIRLPAGLARMAIGVEHRREAFSAQQVRISGLGAVTTPRVQDPGRRTTDAYFGELLLPLLDERAPLTEALTLSLSIRHEESSDFGAATTPKVGIDWRLAPDLRLRGTWGTSFRAPQFTQMLTGTAGQIGSVPISIDPNATNGSTGLLQILGSNRDLEPEEAESWTAGFDFTPRWLEGFRLSATYFDIDFANRIATPGSLLDAFRTPANYSGYFIANPTPQQITDYLALADIVIGAVPPDGIEVIWDERLTNLAALRVRGLDLSAAYSFDTELAQVSVFASASGLLEFSRSANPALASIDVLDTIFNPVDWRARAGVSLTNEHWSGAFALNYADSYRDTLSTPNREIDAWTTYDARLAYRLSGVGRGSTEFALDLRNLTDEGPPFANNPLGVGFDTLNASPVGRVIMAQVTRRW